jgi:hypothetical protein
MRERPLVPEWYVAELVMEITVFGDTRNVVHRNLVLVRADSAAAAYEKATQFGRKAETSYKNPEGQLVQIRFRGVARLEDLYEPLEDGAEIMFEESIGMSREQIDDLIPAKGQLTAFRAPQPSSGPDYSSKEVLDEVRRLRRGKGRR